MAWWSGSVLFGLLFPVLVTRSATTILASPTRSVAWGSLIALTAAGLAFALFKSLVGMLILPIWLLTLLGVVAPGGLAIAGASLTGILMSRPPRGYPPPGALGAGALLLIGMIFPWAGIALFAVLTVLCFGGIAQSGFSGLSKIDNPEGGN